jgi:hypothetical protein
MKILLAIAFLALIALALFACNDSGYNDAFEQQYAKAKDTTLKQKYSVNIATIK